MFYSAQKTYLGIDFGTSSIKVVELGLHDQNPMLLNYGEVSLSPLGTLQSTDQGSYDAQVTIFLRALLERMKPRSKKVSVAMPAFIGLIALVDFPQMSESELEKAIQFEAHKYIPSPLEEVALSWEIVGEREELLPDGSQGRVKKLEVLLVAALNKEVERYESYIKAVGYDMQLLELETFSLVRSTVRNIEGSYIVVDIGSRATNIVLLENGLVKMSRNIDVGGRDMTRTLMEALNISFDRAEALKKSDKDFLNQPQSRITFLSLELIANEIKRMLEARQEKNLADLPIRGIILSGGTAAMQGLTQYLATVLQTPVEIAWPWRGVRYDQRLQAAIERMGTSYSVALGLALRGVEHEHRTAESESVKHWLDFLRQKLTMKIGK